MMQPTFSKNLLVFVAVLTLICVARPASARGTRGSKGGGGSHHGSSHGGGAFHGGGHFSSKGASFKGGGHSYVSSRGGGRVASARSMQNGFRNNERMNGGSSSKFGEFSSRPSGNFARNSNQGRGNFGTSSASPYFGRPGGSPAATQSSQGTMGKWQSFGNSTGRSMFASARISGNAMGGGWRSFGNFNQVGSGGAAHLR